MVLFYKNKRTEKEREGEGERVAGSIKSSLDRARIEIESVIGTGAR